MSWIEPVRLVAMIWSTCSSLSSSAAPRRPYPALLTTTSIRPSRANERSTT
jgi:hypothetical protein